MTTRGILAAPPPTARPTARPAAAPISTTPKHTADASALTPHRVPLVGRFRIPGMTLAETREAAQHASSKRAPPQRQKPRASSLNSTSSSSGSSSSSSSDDDNDDDGGDNKSASDSDISSRRVHLAPDTRGRRTRPNNSSSSSSSDSDTNASGNRESDEKRGNTARRDKHMPNSNVHDARAAHVDARPVRHVAKKNGARGRQNAAAPRLERQRYGGKGAERANQTVSGRDAANAGSRRPKHTRSDNNSNSNSNTGQNAKRDVARHVSVAPRVDTKPPGQRDGADDSTPSGDAPPRVRSVPQAAPAADDAKVACKATAHAGQRNIGHNIIPSQTVNTAGRERGGTQTQPSAPLATKRRGKAKGNAPRDRTRPHASQATTHSPSSSSSSLSSPSTTSPALPPTPAKKATLPSTPDERPAMNRHAQPARSKTAIAARQSRSCDADDGSCPIANPSRVDEHAQCLTEALLCLPPLVLDLAASASDDRVMRDLARDQRYWVLRKAGSGAFSSVFIGVPWSYVAGAAPRAAKVAAAAAANLRDRNWRAAFCTRRACRGSRARRNATQQGGRAASTMAPAAPAGALPLCAIKVFPADTVFPAEMAAGMVLAHPNIANMIEWFRIGANYYLVYEFVPGADLQVVMFGADGEGADDGRGGRIRDEYIAFGEHFFSLLFVQLLAALNFCHANHVAHRDIKLENIVASFDPATGWPTAKLVDFGFAFFTRPPPRDIVGDIEITKSAPPSARNIGRRGARAAAARTVPLHQAGRLTPANEQHGTPGYYAPEVKLRAIASPADLAATDVYSLGVTLYLAMMGRFPRTEAFETLLHEQCMRLNRNPRYRDPARRRRMLHEDRMLSNMLEHHGYFDFAPARGEGDDYASDDEEIEAPEDRASKARTIGSARRERVASLRTDTLYTRHPADALDNDAAAATAIAEDDSDDDDDMELADDRDGNTDTEESYDESDTYDNSGSDLDEGRGDDRSSYGARRRSTVPVASAREESMFVIGRTPVLSKQARDLLRGMLEIQPQRRLTMAQVIDHPWTRAAIARTQQLSDAPGSVVFRPFVG